jgi:hypothetical protein
MELLPPYEGYLQKELEELKRSYHKLLIVCNGNSSALSNSMTALGIPTINLNLELSKALLKVPSNRRSLRVSEIVAKIIKECTSDAIYFNHIELLLHQDLQIDPVRLFLNLSRNQTLIVFWGGEYKDGVLTYAEFGHPEYREYRDVEAKVITLKE